MKIFLTGGTGFIGSNFINIALNCGHEIIAINRNERKQKDVDGLVWAYGDLSGDYRILLEQCDVFVHLASYGVIEGSDNLDDYIYWNVEKTYELCKQAYSSNIRKFIISGSCFEYGRSAERYEFIPSTAPLEPITNYAISKAMASILLYGWASSNNVYMNIMRFFHVYGKGENENRLWPSLKRAALSGKDFNMTQGEQIRDFILVDDLIKSIISALSFYGVKSGIPKINNISSGNTLSVYQFCSYWWKEWNAKGNLLVGSIPYREDEVMRYVPEIIKE
jgi:nucleoside-diphosphate-sugar epimerase